jgi:hypothetical protein
VEVPQILAHLPSKGFQTLLNGLHLGSLLRGDLLTQIGQRRNGLSQKKAQRLTMGSDFVRVLHGLFKSAQALDDGVGVALGPRVPYRGDGSG